MPLVLHNVNKNSLLLKGGNADDLEDEIKNQQDGRIARELALCAGKQRVFYELILEHRR